MQNYRTPKFKKLYNALGDKERRLADQAFAKYKSDPATVNFRQKFRLRDGRGIYSAELNDTWRALAIVDGERVDWFWLGLHPEYDKLLNNLR